MKKTGFDQTAPTKRHASLEMTESTPSKDSSALKTSNENDEPQPVKRISDDDLYRNSTQYRLWSFSKESLQNKRKLLSADIAARFDSKVQSFIEKEGAQLSSDEIEGLQKEMVPITAHEFLQIVTLYAQKVQLFGTKLKLPTEVTSTAVVFFKKYYLENSVLDVHPKNMIFTCMFLACKAENYFINIESFAAKVKQPKESILMHEFPLLESLKFTLMVHHPFKSLHGFFLDIQSILYGKVDMQYLGTVYEKTKKILVDSILTDVAYLYTPPQITLAALLKEDEQLTLKYLELKLLGFNINKEVLNEAEQKRKEQHDKILETVRECLREMDVSYMPSRDEAWRIDARIHYYLDPMAFIKRIRKQKEAQTSGEPAQKKVKVEQ